MHMKRAAMLVAVLCFVIGAAGAQTRIANDPTKISVGARPLGMGKTFTGIADDPSAIFLNPAGLGGIDNVEITSMSGKFINEVDYVQLAGVIPTKFGKIGFGYGGSGLAFSAPSPEVIIIGGEEKVIPSTSGTLNYQWDDRALLFSYGNGLTLPIFNDLQLGGTLKLFSQNLAGSNISTVTASGLNLDIGALAQPRPELKIGAVVQNVLGNGMKWSNGVEEALPMLGKLGLSYRLLADRSLTLGFDYETPLARSNAAGISHLGAEWSPLDVVTLRLGYDGSDPTYGLGFSYDGWRFDYAYHAYNDLASSATNYFSLSLGLFKEKPKATEEAAAIIIPSQAPPMFSDVPDGYWAKTAIETLAKKGVIAGYPDATFKPEGIVSRGELAKILREKGVTKPDQPAKRADGVVMITRAGNLKVSQTRLLEAPYPDLPGRHWAAKEVTAAKEAGLLNYLEGKNFEPDKPLTRAEVAEILYRTTI